MSTAGTTLHAAAPPRKVLFSKPYRVLFMGCTKTSTFLVCVQQGLSMPHKEQSGCTCGSGLFTESSASYSRVNTWSVESSTVRSTRAVEHQQPESAAHSCSASERAAPKHLSQLTWQPTTSGSQPTVPLHYSSGSSYRPLPPLSREEAAGSQCCADTSGGPSVTAKLRRARPGRPSWFSHVGTRPVGPPGLRVPPER